MKFIAMTICTIALGIGAASAHAAAINANQYEIFYGDFNNDGLIGDIYFRGIEKFVLIAGDITIPLMLPGEAGFVYYENADKSYSAGVPLTKTPAQVLGLPKASKTTDIVLGDINSDGIADIFVKGRTDTSSALVINGDKTDTASAIIRMVRNDGAVKTPTNSWSAANTSLENISNRNYQVTINSGVIAVSPLMVKLKGTITYDRVGHLANGGLNYNAITAMPARGVTVKLIGSLNEELASTVSDANGNYEFSAKASSNVKVRVLAQSSNSSPRWSVDVTDNTNSNALYVIEGSLASVGNNTTQVRSLNAASGWVNGSYSATRAAAPFAILDSIYDALRMVTAADASVSLPDLHVRWSVNNSACRGNDSIGCIETSRYSNNEIFILGKTNSDTDEYDRAVVQHELGHFIEHRLSRSDSLGGQHSLSSRLDMRVAFGEAWGNAFSAMAGGDSIYMDSQGMSQSSGFQFDIESNEGEPRGWFNERSIHSLLYDIYDSANDGVDTISLGFRPILAALRSAEYINFSGVTSIYPIIDIIKRNNPASQTVIETLMQNQQIFGRGMYGDGETNNGGITSALPIYAPLTLVTSREVCSVNGTQEYNGLGVRSYLMLNITTGGQYTIRLSGAANTNPNLRVWRNGQVVVDSTSTSAGVESLSRSLTSGVYLLEVYEQGNVDGETSSGGTMCFNAQITQG